MLTADHLAKVGSQEASVSDSQISESGNSEDDFAKKEQQAVQGASLMPLPEVQRVISLYFALCTKKPHLLQLVFNTYGRAPKTVKQTVKQASQLRVFASLTIYRQPSVASPVSSSTSCRTLRFTNLHQTLALFLLWFMPSWVVQGI